MRLLKVLFAAVVAVLALTVGLMIAAGVAVFGLVLMLFGRARVRVATTARPRMSRPSASRERVDENVIDVSATEVVIDPPAPPLAAQADSRRPAS